MAGTVQPPINQHGHGVGQVSDDHHMGSYLQARVHKTNFVLLPLSWSWSDTTIEIKLGDSGTGGGGACRGQCTQQIKAKGAGA